MQTEAVNRRQLTLWSAPTHDVFTGHPISAKRFWQDEEQVLHYAKSLGRKVVVFKQPKQPFFTIVDHCPGSTRYRTQWVRYKSPGVELC